MFNFLIISEYTLYSLDKKYSDLLFSNVLKIILLFYFIGV